MKQMRKHDAQVQARPGGVLQFAGWRWPVEFDDRFEECPFSKEGS